MMSAVDAGVDGRKALQGFHCRADEEAHEAELGAVVTRLKLLAVAPPHRHHRRHVQFVERRQHGRRLLRFHEPGRDAGAQARHRHAALDALVVVGWHQVRHFVVVRRHVVTVRCRVGQLGRDLAGSGFHGPRDILFHHPAALARAGDASEGDTLLGGKLTRSGRRGHVLYRGRVLRCRSRRRFGRHVRHRAFLFRARGRPLAHPG